MLPPLSSSYSNVAFRHLLHLVSLFSPFPILPLHPATPVLTFPSPFLPSSLPFFPLPPSLSPSFPPSLSPLSVPPSFLSVPYDLSPSPHQGLPDWPSSSVNHALLWWSFCSEGPAASVLVGTQGAGERVLPSDIQTTPGVYMHACMCVFLCVGGCGGLFHMCRITPILYEVHISLLHAQVYTPYNQAPRGCVHGCMCVAIIYSILYIIIQ